MSFFSKLKCIFFGLFLLGTLLFPNAIHAVEPTNTMVQNGEYNEKFVIEAGKIGLIKKGMSLFEIEKIVKEQYGGKMETIEEYFEPPHGLPFNRNVVLAYLDDNVHFAFKIILDDKREIFSYEIYLPVFRTKEFVKVGSSWGEVRKNYPKAYISPLNGWSIEIPEINISCKVKFVTEPDWTVIKEGTSAYDNDILITSINLFM